MESGLPEDALGEDARFLSTLTRPSLRDLREDTPVRGVRLRCSASSPGTTNLTVFRRLGGHLPRTHGASSDGGGFTQGVPLGTVEPMAGVTALESRCSHSLTCLSMYSMRCMDVPISKLNHSERQNSVRHTAQSWDRHSPALTFEPPPALGHWTNERQPGVLSTPQDWNGFAGSTVVSRCSVSQQGVRPTPSTRRERNLTHRFRDMALLTASAIVCV